MIFLNVGWTCIRGTPNGTQWVFLIVFPFFRRSVLDSVRGPLMIRQTSWETPADVEKLLSHVHVITTFWRTRPGIFRLPDSGEIRLAAGRSRRGRRKVRLAVGQAGNS